MFPTVQSPPNATGNMPLMVYFMNNGLTNPGFVYTSLMAPRVNDDCADNAWCNIIFTWDTDVGTMDFYFNNNLGVSGGSVDSVIPIYGGGWDELSDWQTAFQSFNPTALYLGRSSSGNVLNSTIDELRILDVPYEPTAYSSEATILKSNAIDTANGNPALSSPVWGNISWDENIPDKTDIKLQVSTSDDGSTWSNWTGLQNGMVTLTFDDGWKSIYDNAYLGTGEGDAGGARDAMKSFGYKGVAYVNNIVRSGGSNPSYMSAAELLELQSEGWEISGHTSTHGILSTISSSNVLAQITDNISFLNGLGLAPTHFAYPRGAVSKDALDVLSSSQFETARTTEIGYNTFLDRYRLRIKEAPTGVVYLKASIDHAIANGEWLIIMYHEIGDSGVGHVPLADFNETLQHLDTNNVPVRTIGEAMDNLSLYSSGQQITAPNRRYIKYRAILQSYAGANTPTLDNVKISEPAKIYQELTNIVSSSGEYTHSAWPQTTDTEVNISITPNAGSVTVDIDTWNTSGDYAKQWTETGTGVTSSVHTVGSLKAFTSYALNVNGSRYGTYESSGSGQINFTYSGGYSEKTFEITEYVPSGGRSVSTPTPTPTQSSSPEPVPAQPESTEENEEISYVGQPSSVSTPTPETTNIDVLNYIEDLATGDRFDLNLNDVPTIYTPTPTFSGKTTPNIELILTIIRGDLIITATVTADNEGNWQYTVDKSLEPGEYSIKIELKSPDGKITGEYNKTFKIAGIQDKTKNITPTTEKKSSKLPYILGGVGLLVVFGLAVILKRI